MAASLSRLVAGGKIRENGGGADKYAKKTFQFCLAGAGSLGNIYIGRLPPQLYYKQALKHYSL